MSSRNQEPGPTTRLLGEHARVSTDQNHGYPLYEQFPSDVFRTVKVTLFQSYVNWLCFLVPVALTASANDWDASAVFILNFLAILGLSSVLSFATDELAKSTGQTIGALVNATFGNALEMIVSFIM